MATARSWWAETLEGRIGGGQDPAGQMQGRQEGHGSQVTCPLAAIDGVAPVLRLHCWGSTAWLILDQAFFGHERVPLGTDTTSALCCCANVR
jgi:hypothetical protein